MQQHITAKTHLAPHQSTTLATATISNSPPNTPHATTIINTGATDHYFTTATPLLHINTVAPPTTLGMVSGKACTSSATTRLAIPAIPMLHACTGHIMPGFSNNLISLGKLCDAGCTATVDKDHLLVHNPLGNTILQGQWEPTGAWL